MNCLTNQMMDGFHKLNSLDFFIDDYGFGNI